jgi:hypothetical protein
MAYNFTYIYKKFNNIFTIFCNILYTNNTNVDYICVELL